jgi:carbonic anhydrase/acetyltransferase-like protein (isoleucine patch superfamily)
MPLYEFESKYPVVSKSTFVHPQAVIIGEVELGEGCYIGAGAVIRGDFGKIVIGSGSNVQDNCVIHADIETLADIGDNVLIGHGAVIHGPCIINEYAVIGMGSIVFNGSELGYESLLSAGSVLLPRCTVPARKLAMGNPAVIIKEMSAKMITKNKDGLRHYQELCKRYIDGLKLLNN